VILQWRRCARTSRPEGELILRFPTLHAARSTHSPTPSTHVARPRCQGRQPPGGRPWQDRWICCRSQLED
jgi:hypothetical protein